MEKSTKRDGDVQFENGEQKEEKKLAKISEKEMKEEKVSNEVKSEEHAKNEGKWKLGNYQNLDCQKSRPPQFMHFLIFRIFVTKSHFLLIQKFVYA
jgi:hypothetical protein